MSTPFDRTTAVRSAPIPVRFAETDLMGVVHHAAYIVWLELGRIAWLDAAGVPYSEIAAAGHHFAVTGVHAAYRASCSFGDSVVVETNLTKLRSRQVSFTYEIRHAAADTLLVSGRSDHICVDLEGAVARMPSEQFERLQHGLERLAGK